MSQSLDSVHAADIMYSLGVSCSTLLPFLTPTALPGVVFDPLHIAFIFMRNLFQLLCLLLYRVCPLSLGACFFSSFTNIPYI